MPVDPLIDHAFSVARGLERKREEQETLEDTALEGADSELRTSSLAPFLVQIRGGGLEEIPELEIISSSGELVSILASTEAMQEVQGLPNVIAIEESKQVDATLEESDGTGSEFENDSISWVRGRVSHSSEKGDGAIIGIIDTGVDILHEAFRDSNGASKIIAFWDQTDSSGPSPSSVDSSRFTSSIGRLWTQDELTHLLDAPTAGIPRVLRDNSSGSGSGHGTLVASIAAGSPHNGFAGGIAPEAKLIIVKANSQWESNSPRSLGYSVSHHAALQFFKEFSDSDVEKRPMVINISQGQNAGAHDGSSLVERAFDEFTFGGRASGLALVKSAGNEGGQQGHAEMQLFQGGQSELKWESFPRKRNVDTIEIWYDSANELSFTLASPSGAATTTVDLSNPTFYDLIDTNMCRIDLIRYHRDNGDSLLKISILSDYISGLVKTGIWSLTVSSKDVKGSQVLHAWVERNRNRPVKFHAGETSRMTLSIPGTADSVISVGACRAEFPLKLAHFSSLGPTRDGRKKPDLVAPGVEVTGADANDRDGDHSAQTSTNGTSYAAPHVTGAIALLFSMLHKHPYTTNSQLNAQQVRAILRDSLSGFHGGWHEGFGYGALDVENAIDRVGSKIISHH